SGSGVPAAVTESPAVTGTPRAGHTLRCHAAVWTVWAGVRASSTAFAFDGYTWLRDGRPVADHHSDRYVPGRSDRGHPLSCVETATYPAPFHVTARAVSPLVTVR